MGFLPKIMIYQQNKTLADNAMAGLLKISPFFVKDYKAAARNYNEAQLERIFYTLGNSASGLNFNSRDLEKGGLDKGNDCADFELIFIQQLPDQYFVIFYRQNQIIRRIKFFFHGGSRI